MSDTSPVFSANDTLLAAGKPAGGSATVLDASKLLKTEGLGIAAGKPTTSPRLEAAKLPVG